MSKVKKKKAEQAFLAKQYEESLKLYGEVYTKNPQDGEAKVGVLLSDFASEYEEEAQALFDYYLVARAESEGAEGVVEDIIKNFDGNNNKILSIVNELIRYDKNSIDGIMYDEFKMIVKSRGDFKVAFEDLMFSTRVIFEHKEDLLEFVDTLVDNGYGDMAMSYLEDTALVFPYDNKIQKIVKKLKLKN